VLAFCFAIALMVKAFEVKSQYNLSSKVSPPKFKAKVIGGYASGLFARAQIHRSRHKCKRHPVSPLTDAETDKVQYKRSSPVDN